MQDRESRGGVDTGVGSTTTNAVISPAWLKRSRQGPIVWPLSTSHKQRVWTIRPHPLPVKNQQAIEPVNWHGSPGAV